MKNNNLIAINGKIGHGKDTIGNIIQILTALPHLTDTGVKSFLGREIDSPYQIKKFADKLKDMVCLLIGCTREQLECREFKEKELGEEWWQEYEDLVGTESDGREITSLKYDKLTPRKLMQLLGTEAGRNIIHPNIWINSLFANYVKLCDIHKEGNRTKCMCYRESDDSTLCETEKPSWIITDMRFPNEFEAVKQRNGITIRVERPYQTVEGEGNGNWATFSQTQFHPSETSLDYVTDWSYVIDNNSTIEDLIKKVREILIKENII